MAVLLVKRGERIFAITETCPHLGGPLSEGKLVGDAIQCPWHNSELALEDGHVVNGPTTFPARCFDVRVREGQIEVRAAPVIFENRRLYPSRSSNANAFSTTSRCSAGSFGAPRG